MQNPAHCLHPMLPSNNKSLHLLLRKRGICFLFRSDYNLYKNFFLPRLLFLGLYNFLKFVIILCVFFVFCICVCLFLYQFLCIAHVWWVRIEIHLFIYLFDTLCVLVSEVTLSRCRLLITRSSAWRRLLMLKLWISRCRSTSAGTRLTSSLVSSHMMSSPTNRSLLSPACHDISHWRSK